MCDYKETDGSFASIRDRLQALVNVAPRTDGVNTTAWRLEKMECAVMATFDSEAKVTHVIVRAIGHFSKRTKHSR